MDTRQQSKPARHTIEHVNDTDMQVGWISGRLAFPKHSLTVIVKGTFDLHLDQIATLDLEEPIPLSGPQHYDDNPEASLRYESDFVHFKPNTDLELVGTCHVPDGRPRSSCPVTFGVGEWSRTLHVIGQRFWESQKSDALMTPPIPFEKGPIRYEYAFGGPQYDRNPVGKGIDAVYFEGKERIPLPNIETPDHLLTTFNQRTTPAGFGPLSRSWHPRASKCGTYDENWLKTRWPWLAEDLDWSFFNSAPIEQQLSKYLTGEESLYFQNLHPDHSEYRSALPRLRVRAFVNRLHKTDTIEPTLEEIRMNLDTLWVDMDQEKLVLVWRGATQTSSEINEDIQLIYFMKENLDAEPASVPDVHSRITKAINPPIEHSPPPESDDIDTEIAEAEQELDTAIVELDKDSPFNISELINKDGQEASRQAYHAQIRNTPKDIGLAKKWSPKPDEESEKLIRDILAEHGLDDLDLESLDGDTQPLDRSACLELVSKGESLIGKDLRNVDLSHCELEGIDFSKSIMTGADLRGAQLTKARFTQANLSNAHLVKANLKAADFYQADLTSARLMEANLSGARLEGATLSEAILHSAQLVHSNAQRADFNSSDLRYTNFTGSNMELSDFTKCQLDGAQFNEVSAVNATFENASGEQIDFSRSNLKQANFSEGCRFSNCLFVQSSADESIWDTSVLKSCDFRGSSLLMASFEATDLSGAILLHCNLSKARFIGADLSNSVMQRANLFQSTLEKADLRNADLSYCNLYEAETRDTLLSKAILQGANIKMTKLS